MFFAGLSNGREALIRVIDGPKVPSVAQMSYSVQLPQILAGQD